MSLTNATWREILRLNFRSWGILADFLQLDDHQRSYFLSKPSFPLNVPLRLAEKIPKKTLHDPILAQFLPTTAENDRKVLGFLIDPVGDQAARCSTRLLKKYQNRALIIASGSCAMHCRYCFRQNFDYALKEKSFEEELSLIERDQTINEVILSGGDPLSLSDSTLQQLIQSLEKIPHIRKLRFHTRFPIGIPERIDDSFLAVLESTNLQVWFVLHVNHPREFDSDVIGAIKKIQKLGIPVLNQSVLLRGVNDDEKTLTDLSEILVNHGIIPYYLHQLDRVQGAGHFEVKEERGKELMKHLQSVLPGYGVPKYVREIPGEPSKTPL